MDYCEWLRNSSFLTYVGPDEPWGENLACFGTHLETHHALLHRPAGKKGFHSQDVDPYLYSGVPYVSSIIDLELKLGNPLGTFGIYTGGSVIIGRVLKCATNRFSLEFYPHMMQTNMSLESWTADTLLTYSDSRTLFARVTLTNEEGEKKSVVPFFAGRIYPGFQGYGIKEVDHLSLKLVPAGKYPFSHICIKPGFNIAGHGFSTDGFAGAVLNSPGGKGEACFTWASNALFYAVTGVECTIDPGAGMSFDLRISVSGNRMESECGVRDRRTADPVEKASRAWYNEYFSKAPEPPEDLSEIERKYYYGSFWVQRHNEYEPRGDFKYTHWLHSRGFYGRYTDRLFAADLPFLTWQQREIDPELAKCEILEAVHRQTAEGRIGVMGSGDVGRTQSFASLSTFAALSVYERDGDKSFLETIYSPLVRYHEWWFREKDMNMNGIVEVADSLEAANDNNVVYMDMLGPIEAVDLNCFLYVDRLSLARVAEILGNGKESGGWQDRASELREKIVGHFFDEESGMYWNRLVSSGEFVRIKSIHNTIMPLWANIPDEKTAERILREYVLNENCFYTRFPFPDVSRDEIYYSSARHTGTTWPHLALFVLQALCNYGLAREAEEARRRIIENVARSRRFWQYWDPEGGGFEFREMGPDHRCANVSWTAAGITEIILRRYEELSGLLKRISDF